MRVLNKIPAPFASEHTRLSAVPKRRVGTDEPIRFVTVPTWSGRCTAWTIGAVVVVSVLVNLLYQYIGW